LLDHGGVEVQLKNSYPQLTILRRKVGQLNLDDSLLFILIIEQIAFNSVGNGLVLGEGVDIIPALPQNFIFLFGNDGQTRWVVGYFKQECFVEY